MRSEKAWGRGRSVGGLPDKVGRAGSIMAPQAPSSPGGRTGSRDKNTFFRKEREKMCEEEPQTDPGRDLTSDTQPLSQLFHSHEDQPRETVQK